VCWGWVRGFVCKGVGGSITSRTAGDDSRLLTPSIHPLNSIHQHPHPPHHPHHHPHTQLQEELIQSEFAEPGSLQRAIDLVVSTGGVERARQLARDEADKALKALAVLPPSRAKRSLELMVDYVLDRIY